jgi:TPP-dependent pyruvate/acetoin dehydrogenase alpha subunit
MTTDPAFWYARLFRIRCFEETVLSEFRRGIFAGTTHTYLGQEADAVGVLSQIGPADVVVSNHRCHGHFLAYGGSPLKLFLELMGKPGGVCAGRGGSQHLHWKNFYSNGIQGGTLPMAVGMALAEKRKHSGALAVVFLGDGTLGEGAVYEALNLAALWEAPVLFVVENNHIAQTTPTGLALAGSISARFSAFGIPPCELDSSDVLEISASAAELLAEVRKTSAPRALVLNTERFGPHSKGDDTRPEGAVARLRQVRDPLVIQAARLEDSALAALQVSGQAEISQALRQALEA